MSVGAVGTDSRSLPPSCLFVALRGDRFDGHAFVPAAVEAGALAVLVDGEGDRDLESLPVPRLVVRDTLYALGELARHALSQRRQPVIAVTGSNGKTTTKELLAAALSSRAPVHRTAGNLNNLIGLPLTALAWPEEAWAAVLEMGMSAPGEIARLTEIAAPAVGLVTNVGPAHLLGLGSVDNVARAKGELYAGLGADAIAVVNADDEVVQRVALELTGSRRRISFGRAAASDVRVLSQDSRVGASRVRLAVLGREIEVELPLVGAHNAMNAAAAAAGALALGLSVEEIVLGMPRVSIPGGRLRVVQTACGLRLIDDTYNANPASMRAAFAALADIAAGRRVAVLGDMRELGAKAPALHREVGEAAASSGIELLLSVGEHAAELAEGAAKGGAEARVFAGMDELLGALDALLRPGDWVLIKGSRGARMERVTQHLETRRA